MKLYSELIFECSDLALFLKSTNEHNYFFALLRRKVQKQVLVPGFCISINSVSQSFSLPVFLFFSSKYLTFIKITLRYKLACNIFSLSYIFHIADGNIYTINIVINIFIGRKTLFVKKLENIKPLQKRS